MGKKYCFLPQEIYKQLSRHGLALTCEPEIKPGKVVGLVGEKTERGNPRF